MPRAYPNQPRAQLGRMGTRSSVFVRRTLTALFAQAVGHFFHRQFDLLLRHNALAVFEFQGNGHAGVFGQGKWL